MSNTYSDSFGNRWTTQQIDQKSKETSLTLLEEQCIEHGYNFCTHCRRNDCKPIDMAHLISRKEAKEGGFVEVLWSEENQKILGRECHKMLDGLTIFK
tara:strand:+ start:7634 stop:7927 length:294 start_codon:yes stop_codon:yes gene_type:complete